MRVPRRGSQRAMIRTLRLQRTWCGREDSCVTGIWQSGADGVRVAARFQVQYAGPERGRVDRRFDVLVDTSVTFTKDWVRKRGLEPPRVLPHLILSRRCRSKSQQIQGRKSVRNAREHPREARFLTSGEESRTRSAPRRSGRWRRADRASSRARTSGHRGATVPDRARGFAGHIR